MSPEFALAGATLITSLSFTHLKELIAIDDPLQRAFYEVECIRGNWSVRELKRQIGSLYFERSGLSKDKVKLAAREGWRRDFPTWTTSSSSRSTSSNYRVARRSNGLLRPRSESTAKYQVPEILPCVSELRIPRFSRRCARQIFADETNGSLTSWLRMGSIHPAAKIPRGADDMANAEGWKNHMYSNGNNK